ASLAARRDLHARAVSRSAALPPTFERRRRASFSAVSASVLLAPSIVVVSGKLSWFGTRSRGRTGPWQMARTIDRGAATGRRDNVTRFLVDGLLYGDVNDAECL